jgi:transcriptional regulator with XRE-family HTH domain
VVTVNELIGDRIRRWRTHKKMSGAAFGGRLGPYLGGDPPGWSRQTVYEAEKGERDFRISELIALALALNIQIHDLVDGEDAGQKRLEFSPGRFVAAEDLTDLFRVVDRKTLGPVNRAFQRNRVQLTALQEAWASALETDRQLQALFPDFGPPFEEDGKELDVQVKVTQARDKRAKETKAKTRTKPRRRRA